MNPQRFFDRSMNSVLGLFLILLYIFRFYSNYNVYSFNSATRSRRGSVDSPKEQPKEQPKETKKKTTRSRKLKDISENGEHFFVIAFLLDYLFTFDEH